jgi:DNA repair protein RadD
VKLTLRDYQETAISDVRWAYADGCRAPLLTLPTGGGKTVIFSYIAERAGAKGNRVLVLVHRRELLRQTSRTLDDFGVSHGMIAAGMSMDHHQHVQIASVQTMVRRLERLRWVPDLVVVDEAHHATSKTTWGQVLAHYPDTKILGVTATPQRLDGQGLGVTAGGLFDRLIVGPTVAELTAAGHLSPAVVFAPRTMVDLSSIHTRAGDYAQNEVAEAMDKPTITGDAVAHYRQHCPGEPAIAFCASVAHAEHVAASFQAAGFSAASIDGGMEQDTRAQHIEDLGSGRLQVLTSCEIVSEGTDIPIVSAAILLRPTQSLGLYLQQVGRVLRPAAGKRRAVILDHVGNCFRHGLPDDDRDWSLEGRQKRPAASSDALPVRQCTECYHVHRPAPACPRCGWVYPVQSREVEEVAGELEQVDPAEIRRAVKREQAKAKSLEDLVALGKARGYKNPYAWASFVWKARQAKRAA